MLVSRGFYERRATPNIQARGGVILATLQTEAQFMQSAGTYGERITDPASGAVRVTFRNVAPGDYALMVLHDEDGDGQMKMNGYMPAEGWAMVNGDTLRATPTFDQVKFTVAASGADLSVLMSYPRSWLAAAGDERPMNDDLATCSDAPD